MADGSMSAATLAELTKLYAADPRNADLKKAITTAYGLVNIDLQAPAKNLYPVLTPLRNKLRRVPGNGGLSTQWRQISAINNAALVSQGYVPEGQRAAAMNYTTANKQASYATLGADDYITFEAVAAATSFEDLRSGMTFRLLQRMMINEEYVLLGSNNSISLGTPSAPVVTAGAVSGSTLTTGVYSVIGVLLTFDGYSNAAPKVATTGVPQVVNLTGLDGLVYSMNGGSSNKSPSTLVTTTAGQGISASMSWVSGTCAYAWYAGPAGSEVLQAITTVPQIVFSAPLTTGTQSIGQITLDCSAQNGSNGSVTGFDGLLSAALNTANSAYVKNLNGATMTASSKGSINEWDVMLKSMWDNFRVSPTVIYVNSQEQQNATVKVLNATSGPLLRYNTNGQDPFAIVGNSAIEWYYNPFALDGGIKIPVKIHPYLPPGTTIAWCEDLPAFYQSNQVPQVAEVHCRRDYYEQEYPVRTRRYEHGVYAEEVLAVYAPFAMAVITGIGNG